MEKAYKQQICSNLGTFLPIISVLVLLSFYFFFSISESFPFLLTIPIALLSTMFVVTLTKKKGSQNENLVQDELQKEELHPSLDVAHAEVNQQRETAENHEQQAEAHSDYSFPTDSESSNFSIVDRTFDVNVQELRLQEDLESDYSLPSDSESSDGSIIGECFEIGHNGNQNEDLSDDDDDDNNSDGEEKEEEEEDSLIEINLPSNHFSDLTEDPKQKLQSKLPDFLPESFFNQQGLMELLADINEMNEDENLIEIDISMGSINNPDFRLKQELAYFEDESVPSD